MYKLIAYSPVDEEHDEELWESEPSDSLSNLCAQAQAWERGISAPFDRAERAGRSQELQWLNNLCVWNWRLFKLDPEGNIDATRFTTVDAELWNGEVEQTADGAPVK
jgi:hypothetical protein